jgi:hypothetical protein
MAIVGVDGGERDVSIGVYLVHGDRLHLPVRLVLLDDAKRVDPDVFQP